MIEWLIHFFIEDAQNVNDPKIRQKYGILSGGVGIACNLVLFLAKILAGIASGAISIIADAFNNLSDAGSSIITLVGFRMAGKPADRDHPFGHGRIEYLSGLMISVIILVVGAELLKSSAKKIFYPDEITSSAITIVILAGSMLVKFWMAWFNQKLGNRIHSSAMKATAADSLNDCIATAVVLLGVFVYSVTGYNIDGIAGVAVACFILKAGYDTAKDTLQPLLGQKPDPELVKGIENFVLSYPQVSGVHDLIIHDYGPGRMIISLHAEVSDHMDINQAHDIIDAIEKDLYKKYGCEVTIHMDPIATDDKKLLDVREKMAKKIKEIDPRISIHDFRMVVGAAGSNLIFDVLIPDGLEMKKEELEKIVDQKAKEIDEKYRTVIRVEKGYV